MLGSVCRPAVDPPQNRDSKPDLVLSGGIALHGDGPPFSVVVAASSMPGPLPCTADTPDACPLASSPAATAPESSDSHIGLGSGRSPGCGHATQTRPSGGFCSDTCCGRRAELDRHAVRWPGNGRGDNRPKAGAATALPLFSQHILKHRLVQAQLSYQLLQPAVLVL